MLTFMATRSETSRTRNARGEGARLRDEIVEAAAGLLEETSDSSAVTLRAIARAVGIAAPSIYRHFDSQPAIMLAVVDGAFDSLTQALRTAVEGAGDDPREQLLAGCHAYLAFAAEHPGSYRAMFGGVWVPELDEVVTEDRLRSLGTASMAIIGDVLARCVVTGSSSSDAPEIDAVALWLGLHGIAHQRASTRIFPGPEGIEIRIVTALARLT